MKLRNKKTGEKYEMTMPIVFNIKTSGGGEHTVSCESIKELNAEWEDYEEPKGIQCIYYVDHFDAAKLDGVIVGFKTKEEAEKAVEKLKAWKRLEDKGIKFSYWELENGDGGWEPGAYFEDEIFSKKLGIHCHEDISEPMRKDLDLLFGGEE